MNRRLFLGALAAPLLPTSARVDQCAHCDEVPSGAEGTIWCADCLQWYRERYSVEWVRLQPSAGDVITGPNGTRVEVQEIFQTASGIPMIWYFKGDVGLIATMEGWQNMSDWDQARLA